MHWYKWFIGCVLLLFYQIAAAQCPQPSFILPDTVCINEPFSITNTSTGANRYEWDFCDTGIEKQPDWEPMEIELSGATTPIDITTVFADNKWFSFICSRDNNKLLRLDFGSSLDNAPTITDLGNINGLLNRPNGIKFRKEGNNWYALLVNVTGDASNNLLRLNFGDSITNTPTATNIANVSRILLNPRAIDIAEDDGQIVAIIPNYGNNTVSIVNFEQSISNNPLSSDIITISDFSNNASLWDVTIEKSCNQWYGFVVGYNSKFYRLDFGENLFSKANVVDLSFAIDNINSISEIEILYEQNNFYGFIITQLGRFYKIDFAQNLLSSNFSVRQLETYGNFNDADGFEIVRSGSGLKCFFIDWAENKLKKASFLQSCTSYINQSAEYAPENLKYMSEGKKKITLTAYDSNGNINAVTDSIFVRSAIAADFTATKLCKETATQFTSPVNPADNKITSWLWDFGDGSTSTLQNPVHQFATAGIKNVSLTINDYCNHSQTINQSITIYQPSIPNFNAPAEICSFQPVTFQDASTTIDDEIILWQWDFGNGTTAVGKNPTHIYTQAGNFQVSLTITGKSGCTVSIAKPITVKTGANVDFSVQNACFGSQTSFSDQTIFFDTSLDSRIWYFGDGNTSTLANPTHTYATTGTYTVTLSIQNNAGCIVTRTKQIQITEIPKPDFSFSLACSGEPVSFFDESIAVNGSIIKWQWYFSDLASNTNNVSAERNPVHTFTKSGLYDVQLKVFTSNGCADSLTKTISVIAAPAAAFGYQIDCASKEVQFTDQSVFEEPNTITDWYWEMGDGTISLERNPVHTYSSPGAYTVNLIVTATSRCTNKYSQKIDIYPPLVADFSLSGKLCLNNPLIFVPNASASADQITGWLWDFGSLGTSTDPQPQLIFSDTSLLTIPVTLTVTSASGCMATVTKSIDLQLLPKVQFSYKSASDSYPLEVKFIPITSAEVINFEWDFGDSSTSKEKNPTHTYSKGGTYTVQLTASTATGCTTVFIEEVIVNNTPSGIELKLETLSATISNNSITVNIRLYNNSPVAIETLHFNVISEENNPYTQVWNGSLQPGRVLNWLFTIPVNNTFYLPAALCIFAADQVNKKESNSKCVSFTDIFTVFNPSPNPVSDQVKLSFVVPNDGKIAVTVTDVLGKKINDFETDILKPGFNEILYPVTTLAKGIYYFRFSYAGNVQVRKIVIK